MEVWTLEQDEELRAACENAGGDLSAKKLKWWEELAKGFPGSTAKGLQQRWMHIRNLPGLEYKTFVGAKIRDTTPGQVTKGQVSIAGSLAIKAGYGGQRTAALRNERTNTPVGSNAASGTGSGTGQPGGAAARRPYSASAVPRISATQQSAVGRLRGAALASSHTPLLAFSKVAHNVVDKNKTSGVGGAGGASSPVGSPNRGGIDAKDAKAGDPAKETAASPIEKDGGSKKGKGKDSDDNNLIVIHVCDENRGINRDFTCRKDVLLSEMAYFRSYLNGSESCEDIDISVHCDIQIFQWLIKYLNEPDSPPPLDTTNVISILISSQFLKMSVLVDICLAYVCGNLNEILKMPIDLNCLNQELLSKLSGMLTVDVLDELHDRKDKLVSRIYMRKLEELLLEHDRMITRCAFCGKLFALRNRRKLVCAKAKIFIDYYGNVISEHVPLAKWDLNKFLLNLRARKMTWREIYWRIWGIAATLECSVCCKTFAAAELGHCAYCPMPPSFRSGQNHGVFPCCNAAAIRFDTSGLADTRRGCCATDHKVDTSKDPDSTAVFDMMKQRKELVCVAFKDGGAGLREMFDEGGDEEDDSNEDEAESDYTASDSEEDSGKDPSRSRPFGRPFERSSRSRGGAMSAVNLRKRKAKKPAPGAPATAAGRPEQHPKGSSDQRNFRAEMWREEDSRRLVDLERLTEELHSSRTASAAAPAAGAGGGSSNSNQSNSKSQMATFANVSHAANRLLQGRAAKPVTPSAGTSPASMLASGSARQPQKPSASTRPATASSMLKRPTPSSTLVTASSSGSRNIPVAVKPP